LMQIISTFAGMPMAVAIVVGAPPDRGEAR
jgi:hypothetical protein